MRKKQVKTYNTEYTPQPFRTLGGIRKLDIDGLEQALDAVLTDAYSRARLRFAGVQKVKGEKGAWEGINQAIYRLDACPARDCLVYFRSIHAAERAAAKVNGAITMTDYPAHLAEWFSKFTVVNTVTESTVKATKASKAAKALTVA